MRGRKKKTGLVGPVSRGVELDAVTSQHGATGAEFASGWVRTTPVARRVLPQASATDRRRTRRSKKRGKQTPERMQISCQVRASSVYANVRLQIADYEPVIRCQKLEAAS
jgi:hypothetical protein